MASPVTITNTFATQSGNVPASQLDTNYDQLATALNSLSSFSNYFVDSGSANAIAVTINSPLIVAYTAGLVLQIKVANTITGATTIAVNALGTQALLNGDGSAIVANQILAGQVITVCYDGTNFYIQSPNIPESVVSSGTFTGTLTGFTTTVTVTWNYILAAGMVTLYCKTGVSGTSNSSSMDLTGIPTNLAPNYNSVSLVGGGLVNSGGSVLGVATYTGTPGTMVFGLAPVSTNLVFVAAVNNFTASGTKGVGAGCLFSYPIL